jgi:hypothetical protein
MLAEACKTMFVSDPRPKAFGSIAGLVSYNVTGMVT